MVSSMLHLCRPCEPLLWEVVKKEYFPRNAPHNAEVA